MKRPPPPPWTLQGWNREGRPCNITTVPPMESDGGPGSYEVVLTAIHPDLASTIVYSVNRAHYAAELDPHQVLESALEESAFEQPPGARPAPWWRRLGKWLSDRDD